jgi:predicted RNase H-like HicB family nuclease
LARSPSCDGLIGSFLKEGWKTMTQAYKVVIERDTQGGYVATFPDLVGRQAQAGSLKMLMEQIQETMALSPEVGEPAGVPRNLTGVAPDGDDY